MLFWIDRIRHSHSNTNYSYSKYFITASKFIVKKIETCTTDSRVNNEYFVTERNTVGLVKHTCSWPELGIPEPGSREGSIFPRIRLSPCISHED